jgi:hypothetical protein
VGATEIVADAVIVVEDPAVDAAAHVEDRAAAAVGVPVGVRAVGPVEIAAAVPGIKQNIHGSSRAQQETRCLPERVSSSNRPLNRSRPNT